MRVPWILLSRWELFWPGTPFDWIRRPEQDDGRHTDGPRHMAHRGIGADIECRAVEQTSQCRQSEPTGQIDEANRHLSHHLAQVRLFFGRGSSGHYHRQPTIHQPSTECGPASHCPGFIRELRRDMQYDIGLPTFDFWKFTTNIFFVIMIPTDDRCRDRLNFQRCEQAEIHGHGMEVQVIERHPLVQQVLLPSRFLIRQQRPYAIPTRGPGMEGGAITSQY